MKIGRSDYGPACDLRSAIAVTRRSRRAQYTLSEGDQTPRDATATDRSESSALSRAR